MLLGEAKQTTVLTAKHFLYVEAKWQNRYTDIVRKYEMFVVFSVCPSVSWTCLDSRTSRKTPLSSCASTIATRNYSITSISTSLSLNKWVCLNSVHVLSFFFFFDTSVSTSNWIYVLLLPLPSVTSSWSETVFVFSRPHICYFSTCYFIGGEGVSVFKALQFTFSKLCPFSSVMLKHNLTMLHQPSAPCWQRAKEFTRI